MTQPETLPAIPEATNITAAEFDAAMADAKTKATTLKRIVDQAHLSSTIQGRQYLHVEAWQTIGRAYGYSARIDWSRPLDGGGWEARASVVDPFGIVLGAAEAETGTQGDSPWTERASYQQRSMAQTRAISKALRSLLSWVVVLAGYAPTPAEEMPASVSSPAAGGPLHCPIHDVAFFQSANMRTPAHKDDADKWCNFNPSMFIKRVGELMTPAGWSKEDLSEHLTIHFGEGSTWGTLKLADVQAVIESLNAAATDQAHNEPAS